MFSTHSRLLIIKDLRNKTRETLGNFVSNKLMSNVALGRGCLCCKVEVYTATHCLCRIGLSMADGLAMGRLEIAFEKLYNYDSPDLF